MRRSPPGLHVAGARSSGRLARAARATAAAAMTARERERERERGKERARARNTNGRPPRSLLGAGIGRAAGSCWAGARKEEPPFSPFAAVSLAGRSERQPGSQLAQLEPSSPPTRATNSPRAPRPVRRADTRSRALHPPVRRANSAAGLAGRPERGAPTPVQFRPVPASEITRVGAHK